EEHRPLAGVVRADGIRRSLPSQLRPLEEERPEAAELPDGELVERLGVRERLARPRLAELHEGAQPGCGHRGRIRDVYGSRQSATIAGGPSSTETTTRSRGIDRPMPLAFR